jgi:hypothetical protein
MAINCKLPLGKYDHLEIMKKYIKINKYVAQQHILGFATNIYNYILIKNGICN